MMRPISRACRALLIVVGLCALGAAPALAAEVPTIATPTTYRYHADIAITIGASSATGTADGEIDLARQAFHLTIVATQDGEQIRQELILLDDRLYIYSEARQRWEYVDLSRGGRPADLPEATLPPLALPAHPTAPYQQIGMARIGGATVNLWRADGPYNLLLPILARDEFGGVFLQETLTVEAAIGATDRYLYRLTVKEAGEVTELGPTATTLTTATSDLAYSYSDFDQPVTIVAPPGAVPLPEEPGDFLRAAGSPLIRAARHPGQFGLAPLLPALLPAAPPRP